MDRVILIFSTGGSGHLEASWGRIKIRKLLKQICWLGRAFFFPAGGVQRRDLAFSLLSWWPRRRPSQHSRFYRGGRGVAPSSIFTSIVVAAEWPESAISRG